MDTNRIASAIREIDQLTLALDWLKGCGDELYASYDTRFRITVDYASVCIGYKEAIVQLNAIAKFHIQDIVKMAMKDAENTIELLRATIREEAA